MPRLPTSSPWRPLLALLVCAGSPLACTTREIVAGFNDGTQQSRGDPAVSLHTTQRRLVQRAIRDALSTSYFHQGPLGAKAIEGWFTAAEQAFSGRVACSRTVKDAACIINGVDSELGGRFRPDQTEERIAAYLAQEQRPPWRPAIAAGPPLCAAGAPTEAGRLFADGVRFEVAVDRAARTMAGWLDEGLIEPSTCGQGIHMGFDEARRYLGNRRWPRQPRNLALAISGGASNGMFSAGATWLVLEIIQACINEPACLAGGDPRLQLVSGTSAGALVATAVDLFNADAEAAVKAHQRGESPGLRAPALDKLAAWFTCLPANQLYCVPSQSTTQLFSSLVGIADFDGVRYLLRNNVTSAMQQNSSELILNTVDFQTGDLLALSDQDPDETQGCEDVVGHALASIPLPLIAQPGRTIRVQGEQRRGFYLDGGVRSVLPIATLAERGANRVLVVSSSGSVVAPAIPPANAIKLLQRYIDISALHTGGDEVAYAQALAEDRSGREARTCRASCEADGTCLAFCDGLPDAPCVSPAPPPLPHQPSLALSEIYRNETRIDPAAGYSFNPRESLPLFLAGAEAVRERCLEIGSFLGIPVDTAAHAALRARVLDACNAAVPTRKLCEGEVARWPFSPFAEESFDAIRSCNPHDLSLSEQIKCK